MIICIVVANTNEKNSRFKNVIYLLKASKKYEVPINMSNFTASFFYLK